MLDFHVRSGGEGTILVTKVDDPSKYGVVVMDAAGKIERFVEKPQVFVGDKINAGIYVLNPSVLDRIELRPTSIEKEVFPHIAADGKLFAFALPGYWMDVGQPKDYLKGEARGWGEEGGEEEEGLMGDWRACRAVAERPKLGDIIFWGLRALLARFHHAKHAPRRTNANTRAGLNLHLASLRANAPSALAAGPSFSGNALVDPTAKIGAGCVIGPDVSIGAGCVIGDGVRLSNCVIMRGVKVGGWDACL
jgi:mannose-1-phosphate guanylyltransferase